MFGLAVLCAIGIVPPWRIYGVQSMPLGFAPIFNPPDAVLAQGVAGRIDLDYTRLGLEALLTLAVTGGLIIAGAGSAAASGQIGGKPQKGFMARLEEAREQMIAAQLAQQAQLQAQQTAQNATKDAAAAAAQNMAAKATSSASKAPAAASSAVSSDFTRVELPANYYIGEILVESDDDPDYWEQYGAAKGVIDLPKNKKIQLELAKDIRVDLAVLGSFPSGTLYSLDASDCKLTDDDVTKLAVVSGLRELDLTGTPITSSSVSKLRSLGRLEKLWLDGTLINDECVPALGSLSKLKKLSLTETKINELALESLRKDLANCEVVS